MKNAKKIFAAVFFTFALAGCESTTTTPTSTASASAGDDQEVLAGDVVTLDGQASTGVNSTLWAFESRPSGSSATLSGATTLTPTFTADVAGDYVIELSVNSRASTDQVTVTARSVIAAITVPSGSTVTTRTRFNTTENVINLEQTGGILSAETSRGSVASYAWEQVAGPSATATGGTTSTTLEFTAPSITSFVNTSDRYKWQVLPVSRDDAKMIFEVTVTDSSGSTDTETIVVFLQDAGSEIHTSSGLINVAIGETVRPCGPSLDASGASSTVEANEEGDPVTDWSWTLTVPSGSSATFADSGTTSSAVQCPGFVPDVAGLYDVAFSSTTGNLTSTVIQVKAPGTLHLSAAEWVGVGTIGGTTATAPQCATCHDGGVQPDKVTGWSGTVHASKFENSMQTYAGLAPVPFLWEFHTVGYNTDAVNDGFDDLANSAGFTFPEDGLTFAEFTSSEPDVAVLANIQCENCHGPGSMHDGDPTRIALSFSNAGVCGQCHIQEAQWKNSAHNSAGVQHGSGAYQSAWLNVKCQRCHTAKGFHEFVEEGEEGVVAQGALQTDIAGGFPGITCGACHNPHDATNEHQLRLAGEITMAIDGSTVDAGEAAVCYTCHDGNYSLNETDCDSDDNGVADAVCETADQTAIQYWRGGYHYAVAGPMLEGKQALTDLNEDGTADLTLDENSFHTDESFTLADVTGNSELSDENNKCVTCHMAESPAIDEEGYQHLGGHTFKLRSEHGLGHLLSTDEGDEAEAEAGDVQLLSACTVCHASVTDFNREARADYDGDGNREGIQDEVKGLLFNLWNLMKVIDTANGSNMNQAVSTCGTTSNSTLGPTSSDDTSAGTITVNSVAWSGCCSSFSGTTGAQCGSGLVGTGTCANVSTTLGKTKDSYQQCNFVEAPEYLRRAVWNFNSVVRDGSLGIHNAAYTVQLLQETYKALGRLSGLNKSGGAASATTFTYQTDFASATLR